MPDASLLASRYELHELIGSGAMGKVWRARDVTLRRVVAVKTVNLAAHSDDPSVLARFRREAVATAGLSSPYVVGVYDAGRDGNLAYLVMELLEGPSLKAIITEKGPLPWAQALDVAEGVARGLAAAHAVGVTHRDIKPGNVVVVDGVPKIVDFGIARLAETGDETLTAPSTVTGTAAYMSPEQARGVEVAPSSDLYSFGCLLMTMLTGGTPFHGDHPIALARAHVSDEPPLLSSRRPDVPVALDALVTRLLSKNPNERPDALETADELKRIATTPGEPVATPTQAIAAVVPLSEKAERTAVIPVVRLPVAPARRGLALLPWVAGLVGVAALGGAVLLLVNQPDQGVALPTPTVVRTVTYTPTATSTVAAERRTTTVPRRTPRATPRRTASPTAAPTSATPSPTATPTPTPTPTATASPAPTASAVDPTPTPGATGNLIPPTQAPPAITAPEPSTPVG